MPNLVGQLSEGSVRLGVPHMVSCHIVAKGRHGKDRMEAGTKRGDPVSLP